MQEVQVHSGTTYASDPVQSRSEFAVAPVNDVTTGKPSTITLPDISSKAFWIGTDKAEMFHPETYRRWLESTKRTLEAMVSDGLLERYRSREARSIVLGGETTATVVRYGLPGTVSVVRDTGGADNAIAGEYVRVS